MKKVMAILIVLMTVVLSCGALADTYYWFECGFWYSVNERGEEKAYENKPLEWRSCMVNYNFPDSVIRDVSKTRKQYNGTSIGWLGLMSTKGSNLRTQPRFGDSYIGLKLHGNTTVYAYFNMYDSNGNEWYYVTCTDGTCGFLLANRVQLIQI